jgi:hypothetical protein
MGHINYSSNGVQKKREKRKGENKAKGFSNCPLPLQLENCQNDFFK